MRQSEEEDHVGNIIYLFINSKIIALLHKDLRMCVTGVMHEHSFMQNVYYLLFIK